MYVSLVGLDDPFIKLRKFFNELVGCRLEGWWWRWVVKWTFCFFSDFTILVIFFWLFQMFNDQGFYNPQFFISDFFERTLKMISNSITNYIVQGFCEPLWSFYIFCIYHLRILQSADFTMIILYYYIFRIFASSSPCNDGDL